MCIEVSPTSGQSLSCTRAFWGEKQLSEIKGLLKSVLGAETLIRGSKVSVDSDPFEAKLLVGGCGKGGKRWEMAQKFSKNPLFAAFSDPYQ